MLRGAFTMKTSTTWKVLRADHQAPLLDVLARHLGVSRKQAKRLLDDRAVFVNQRRVWMARHLLHAGDQIEVTGARPPAATGPAEAIRATTLREQADWIVVNKPPGLTTNGPDSLETILRQQRNEPALEAVHRLDRDTSGCVLFARHPAAREKLVALFEEKSIRKTYLAIVQGAFPPHIRRVDQGLEGREAITDFRVWDANTRASLVEARPLTGRTHQIRLHARAAGHPLAGDRTYATGSLVDAEIRRLPRQMLHAWRLGWLEENQQEVRIEAPWPDDFRKALDRFGLRSRKEPA